MKLTVGYRNVPTESTIHDITYTVEKVEISGTIDSFFRQCTLTCQWTNTDPSHSVNGFNMGCGATIYVWDENGALMFEGIIFTRTLDGENGQVVTCNDPLYYLTKNTVTINAKKASCVSVIHQVLDKCGIPKGGVQIPDGVINKLFSASTALSVVQECLDTISKQTGLKYVLLWNMASHQVDLRPLRMDRIELPLTPDNLIGSHNYQESIEDTVNVAEVYDENGGFMNKFVDQGSEDMYGTMAINIIKKKDEDANRIAQLSLHGGAYLTMSIEALGDNGCIAGRVVNVTGFALTTAQQRDLFITSDNHTYDASNDSHIMSLDLAWEDVWTYKDMGDLS